MMTVHHRTIQIIHYIDKDSLAFTENIYGWNTDRGIEWPSDDVVDCHSIVNINIFGIRRKDTVRSRYVAGEISDRCDHAFSLHNDSTILSIRDVNGVVRIDEHPIGCKTNCGVGREGCRCSVPRSIGAELRSIEWNS